MDTQLDVPGLAIAYRRLVLLVGVQLLVGILGRLVVLALQGSILGLVVALVNLLVLLVTVVLLAVYAYRTAGALGSSLAILWGLAMVVPCINLLTLLALSSKATKACREVGIPVGLLGPKQVNSEKS